VRRDSEGDSLSWQTAIGGFDAAAQDSVSFSWETDSLGPMTQKTRFGARIWFCQSWRGLEPHTSQAFPFHRQFTGSESDGGIDTRSQSAIPAWDYLWKRQSGFSMHSSHETPRQQHEPRVSRSMSSRMEAACGPRPTTDVARGSISLCPPRQGRRKRSLRVINDKVHPGSGPGTRSRDATGCRCNWYAIEKSGCPTRDSNPDMLIRR